VQKVGQQPRVCQQPNGNKAETQDNIETNEPATTTRHRRSAFFLVARNSAHSFWTRLIPALGAFPANHDKEPAFFAPTEQHTQLSEEVINRRSPGIRSE